FRSLLTFHYENHFLYIVVDTGDVEEVVLVVEGEQAFHLGGVHAAVGLHDVDDRKVEVGEDVDLHPPQGQTAPHEQPGQGDHDGDRSFESKVNRVHRRALRRKQQGKQAGRPGVFTCSSHVLLRIYTQK